MLLQKSLSHVRLSAMVPWTTAYQALLWDFPDKNIGMGCHFLPHQKSKVTYNSLANNDLALSPLLFTCQFIRKM